MIHDNIRHFDKRSFILASEEPFALALFPEGSLVPEVGQATPDIQEAGTCLRRSHMSGAHREPSTDLSTDFPSTGASRYLTSRAAEIIAAATS
jgi:hypothetical protein